MSALAYKNTVAARSRPYSISVVYQSRARHMPFEEDRQQAQVTHMRYLIEREYSQLRSVWLWTRESES